MVYNSERLPNGEYNTTILQAFDNGDSGALRANIEYKGNIFDATLFISGNRLNNIVFNRYAESVGLLSDEDKDLDLNKFKGKKVIVTVKESASKKDGRIYYNIIDIIADENNGTFEPTVNINDDLSL